MLLEHDVDQLGTKKECFDDVKEWTNVKDYSELKRSAEDRNRCEDLARLLYT